MSLTDTDVKAKYNANGVTDTFAIPFDEMDDYSDEVEVYTVDESDIDNVVETLKAETTDFTFSGTNVVFVSAPASGLKVLIRKKAALIQNSFEGDSNGPYPAVEAEAQYDRIVAMIQVLNEKIQRALKWRKSIATASVDPELPDAGDADELIAWNATGTGLKNAGVSATEVLAAADAAAQSASDAAASADAAATSESNAALSEAAAQSSEDDAEAAQLAAEAAQLAAEAAAATVVAQGPFSILDNNAVAADITNFKFLTSSNIGSFVMRYTRGALAGVMTLRFYKDAANNWFVAPPLEDGDPSGLTITLVVSGLYQQVQYVSDNTGAGDVYWVGSSI